jgi:acyl-CoA thioesterase
MKGNIFSPQLLENEHIECDSSWYQGKGVYGGLIFAYFVQGFCARSAFSIRSLEVTLCRPLKKGSARFSFECVCRGSKTEFWRALLYQEEAVVAIASAVMGGARSTAYDYTELKFPSVPSSESLPSIPNNPMMPRFCQNIAYRLCIGAAPFSGSSSSKTGGWLSFREDECHNPFVQQVALIDAWWPSMVLKMKRMHRMGTVSFSCHFFSDVAPPYLFVGQTRSIQDGYASERNELWSQDGKIVAIAQQMVAIIH